MKKLLTIVILCVLSAFFCSCESEEVKQAKESYAEGEYAEVVELLSDEQDLDTTTQDMLIVSEANVLFENKEYLEAIKKITTSSDGIESKQYEKMYRTAVKEAVDNESSEMILELLKIDNSKEDIVYKAITDVCNEMNYNGFIVLDELEEKLNDGELKTKLSSFIKTSDTLRAKSFLVGMWTGKSKTSRIEVIPYKKNLVGKLIKTRGDWGFQKGDILWQDFEFEDRTNFLCSVMIRYDDGSFDRPIGTCNIDYKKGTMSMYVAEAEEKTITYYRIDK